MLRWHALCMLLQTQQSLQMITAVHTARLEGQYYSPVADKISPRKATQGNTCPRNTCRKQSMRYRCTLPHWLQHAQRWLLHAPQPPLVRLVQAQVPAG
jgi:hypothetical protein